LTIPQHGRERNKDRSISSITRQQNIAVTNRRSEEDTKWRRKRDMRERNEGSKLFLVFRKESKRKFPQPGIRVSEERNGAWVRFPFVRKRNFKKKRGPGGQRKSSFHHGARKKTAVEHLVKPKRPLPKIKKSLLLGLREKRKKYSHFFQLRVLEEDKQK